MKEDKLYEYLPYLRGDDVVKFYGGELHGQYERLHYQPFILRVPTSSSFLITDYTEDISESNHIKIGKYKKFVETFWITNIGVYKLNSYYFCGIGD